MKIDINKIVKEIIQDIDPYINDEYLSKDQIASYIVGATLAREDYDDIIEAEPKIEELAEMASNLEVDVPYEAIRINIHFNYMLDVINQIKQKYSI